jgi:hypothetical protein
MLTRSLPLILLVGLLATHAHGAGRLDAPLAQQRLIQVKAYSRTLMTAQGRRTIQVKAHSRVARGSAALATKRLVPVGQPAPGVQVVQPIAKQRTTVYKTDLASLGARLAPSSSVKTTSVARNKTIARPRVARAVTLQPTASQTVEPSTVAPLLSPAQQARTQQTAIAVVRSALEPWTAKGSELVLRPSIMQFGGDARHPITGNGPIEIRADVTPPQGASRWARIVNIFSKQAHSTFYVQVDPQGGTQILDRVSATPQSRLFRAISSILPVRELVGDLFHSTGVREGIVTGGLGLLAMSTSPLLTGGGLAYAAKLAYDGIARRKAARGDALTSTLTMIDEQRQQTAQYPTLLESYRFFKSSLESNKPGTTPWSIRTFSEKLAQSGL